MGPTRLTCRHQACPAWLHLLIPHPWISVPQVFSHIGVRGNLIGGKAFLLEYIRAAAGAVRARLLEVLRGVEVFQPLSEEQLQTLVDAFSDATYVRGEWVFEQGVRDERARACGRREAQLSEGAFQSLCTCSLLLCITQVRTHHSRAHTLLTLLAPRHLLAPRAHRTRATNSSSLLMVRQS